MEYVALCLGVIVGVAVAFFCMMFYRQGLKDGRADRDGKALPAIIEKKPLLKKEEERKPSVWAQFLGANGDSKK